MLWNRALEVKMIKKKDASTDDTPTDLRFDEKTKIIGRQIDKTVMKIGAVVCIYVALDALRQVWVAQANQ